MAPGLQALATDVTLQKQRTMEVPISSTLLAGAGSINSSIRRARGFNSVQVLARAQAAAIGTIRIFQSNDGVNFVLTDFEATQLDSISGESVAFLSAPIIAEFVRVTYLNGAVAQTAFSIQAYLLPVGGAGGGGGGGGGGFTADTRNADADADFAKALIGVLTNTRLSGFDSLGATNDWRRLEARDGTSGADIASTTAVGLIVNSRTVGFDVTSSQYNPIAAETQNLADGTADLVTARGLYVLASVFGKDTTGATILRQPEVSVSSGQQGTTNVRWMTDAIVRGFDVINGLYKVIGSVPEIANLQPQFLNVTQGRDSAFLSSREGRRYMIKGSNAGTIAGAVGFTATTPSFLLVAGATNELVIRKITVTLSTPGGGQTSSALVVKTDTADRFSAGGTARAPTTMNNGNVVATTIARNLELPTATAEGGGTRQDDQYALGIGIGAMFTREYEDGLIIVAGGSLLIYLVDGTAAGNYMYDIEAEDVNVQ